MKYNFYQSFVALFKLTILKVCPPKFSYFSNSLKSTSEWSDSSAGLKTGVIWIGILDPIFKGVWLVLMSYLSYFNGKSSKPIS